MGLAATVGSTGAFASTWTIEPLLGVSADYTSNPELRPNNGRAEDHIAALVDLPVRFDDDELEWTFRPNGRLSNSRGYSSLASSYLHVDSGLQYSDDRDTLNLQSEYARDSSLYFAGALVEGLGVRRDTELFNGEWTHLLTERLQLQLDGSWTKVIYDEPHTLGLLVDYRYLSGGPSLIYNLTERDTVKLNYSNARYDSLNGLTESRPQSLDLGFARLLSEVWTVNVSAGYSRSPDSQKEYFGPFYLGTLDSTQTGANYSVLVSRHGENLNLSTEVTRALTPTGFAYLSHQDAIKLTATYQGSERLDYSLSSVWQRSRNAEVSLGGVFNQREVTVRYLNASFTINWHLTQQWTLATHFVAVNQHYTPPSIGASSAGISFDLVRQFLKTEIR
jgi:hypothetical protein